MIARACNCHACRARNDRTFWRIIEPLRASTPRPWLGLPPVPQWDDTPERGGILPRILRGGEQ